MPERADSTVALAFSSALAAYQRQLRISALASAVLAGTAAGALGLLSLQALPVEQRWTVIGTVSIALITSALLTCRAWAQLRLSRVALVVDRTGRLDNLVVTAEELIGAERPGLRAAIADEVFRQACDRLERRPPKEVAPLRKPAAFAAGGVIALAALTFGLTLPGSQSKTGSTTASAPMSSTQAGDLRVIVTPPAYVRRDVVTAVNPASVTALEGSRVRLEMAGAPFPPIVVGPGDRRVPFTIVDELAIHEFTATESSALLVRLGDGESGAARDRLVYIAVEPDARPIVMIRAPGKDLLFGDADVSVPVEIEARDDVQLDALALRFTRVSGSGESFTFEDGSLPVEIIRKSSGEWEGRGVIRLGTLGLEEGDSLVYHATARDQKPGADPSLSESFLVEIGRVAGIATTGFALPDDRERQALSQQMVIIKTERLQAERPKLTPDAFAEQARLVGVEQRMVRAEFVFMTGGEVEDEVEEAGAAHELAEGRQENRGQAELLTAVREMARAEARLNASDTAGALIFERAALRALQRAFDRRRYLLRTPPERARIDLDRRLRGELVTARSTTRERAEVRTDPVVSRARAAMLALSAREPSAELTADLAAELLALDSSDATLHATVVKLSSESNAERRQALSLAVGEALSSVIRSRLAAAADAGVPDSALRTRFIELSRTPR